MPENHSEKSARAQEVEALILEAVTPQESSAALNYALDSLLEEPPPITDGEARAIRLLVKRKIEDLLTANNQKPG